MKTKGENCYVLTNNDMRHTSAKSGMETQIHTYDHNRSGLINSIRNGSKVMFFFNINFDCYQSIFNH
ncbi:hypothetical protein BLOT_006315 [Blomia tropicalis]|nr:hypothetical protein BLOT_006315 [Blomia tropicalis]